MPDSQSREPGFKYLAILKHFTVLAGAIKEPRESVRPGKWHGADQRGGQVTTW